MVDFPIATTFQPFQYIVVEKEQSIVVLESDKATMDVPSSHSGVVKEVKVKIGDNLSQGSVVITLEEWWA